MPNLLKVNSFFKALIVLLLMNFSLTSLKAQTEEGPERIFQTVFVDDFDRGPIFPLSDGGIPSAAYTTTTTVSPAWEDLGGTSRTRLHNESETDFTLQLLAQHKISDTEVQSGNHTEVSAPLASYDELFDPILKDNYGLVSWTYAMKNNRNSTGGTAGFQGTQMGAAVVLAATDGNFYSPSSATSNGYAVIIVKESINETNGYAASLIKFSNGLSDRTVIVAPPVHISNSGTSWITINVVYNPENDEWTLSVRDEDSTTAKGDVMASTPALTTYGTAVDATYTSSTMTHFGFALNTPNSGAPGAIGNALSVDDYTVKVEESTPAEEGELVLDVNFDNHTGDFVDYNVAMASEDFNGIENRVSAEIRGLDTETKTWPQRTKVGEQHLRAHFPAEMATGRKTGFLFDKGIPATEGAIMEYRVKFSEGFQWKLGGKLPGLGGAIEGGGYPVGCTDNVNRVQNGFTARLMWRRDGRLVVYTYFPERDLTKCGEDISFLTNAETNRWYTVRQHLTLNAPGQRNGSLKMYVDGELVLDRSDLLIRLEGKENVKIDRTIFHTYAGGSDDADWWSTEDQYVHFDDFKVWVNTSDAPETELTVNITSPEENANIVFSEGMSLDIAAHTMDAEGIEKAIFSIDGEVLSEDLTAPYTATWIPATPKVYSIGAKVINTRGSEEETSISVRIYEVEDESGFQTVFSENFDRESSPLSNGGDPAVEYTTTTTTAPPVGSDGGTTRTVLHNGGSTDYMLQVLAQHDGQTGHHTEVSAPLSSYEAPFKPVLSENAGIVSWKFVMKNNRSSLGGSPGFEGTHVGLAAVLVATGDNFYSPNGSTANGYAVVILEDPESGFSASLIKFENGLSNRTLVAGTSPSFSSNITWISVRIDYNPATDEWTMFLRDDESDSEKGNIFLPFLPLQENGIAIDNSFTDIPMTHFGFSLNTPNVGAPGAVGNALSIDDYSVRVAGEEEEVISAIENEEALARFVVYPNPSNGKVSFNTTNDTKNGIKGNYTVYNSNGEIIASGKMGNTSPEIDLSGKAKGLVFVKVETKDWVQVKKVIIGLL